MAVGSSSIGEAAVGVPEHPSTSPGQAQQLTPAKALAQLSEAYRAGLVDFCRRLTGSPDDAEDIASEALLRAAEKFARFTPRGKGSVRAWLVRIALNIVRDRARRQARERRALEGLARIQPTAAPDSDDLGAWSLVAALPLPLRAAVILRMRYQLDYDEIAQALGCRPSTARWRVHKALRTLAEMMGDEA